MPKLDPAVGEVSGGDVVRVVSAELPAVVGQRMLQCCFPEKLQAQGAGCFHVLPGDFSGGITVLLLDGT